MKIQKYLKKSQFFILNVSKGLVHGSCQKIDLFTMCAFWQTKEEKIAF